VSHTKKLSIFNLTKENLELIERLYHADFREWGYHIMSEIIPEEILARNEDLLRQAIEKRNKQRPTKKVKVKNLTKVTG
jgi:isocitrate dehydrogenase